MSITSTEFQNNVGRYQDEALKRPVKITKNGRPHTVLLSAEQYELLLKGRLVRRTEDLDEETLKAIAEAEMPPGYDHLDQERD